jgi:hypothetical protein
LEDIGAESATPTSMSQLTIIKKTVQKASN